MRYESRHFKMGSTIEIQMFSGMVVTGIIVDVNYTGVTLEERTGTYKTPYREIMEVYVC